jgi:ketosteroid isomerase-like protein
MELQINGGEKVEDPNTPYAALVHFYTAFNLANEDMMRDCWLQTEQASMSNPLGGVKRGWSAIAEVYEKIFNGPARVFVEFYDYSIYESGDMFCAVGRERGHLDIDGQRIELKIRTSRIYCRDQGDWKQLHHHGSMDDADLLQRYQSILSGR